MKSVSKKLKKALSLILVLTMFVCAFSLQGHASVSIEDDVLSSFRWKTAPYYSKYNWVYVFVLSPRFVERANVVIYDSERDDRELVENEEYTIHTEEFKDYGTCFVITLVTNGVTPFLKQGSFIDEKGKESSTIYLMQNFGYTERGVASFDKNTSDVLQPGESLTVSFLTEGCVSVNDEMVAENVYQYTWEPVESGEYDMTLSISGLTVGKYTISVKNSAELAEEREAELKNSLPEIAWEFFKSIPIAIVMFPTLPLLVFGWIPGILALGPIEYAGQFFDALLELYQLRTQK